MTDQLHIILAPLLPLWALWILASLSALLVILAWQRRAKGIIARAIGLSLLLLTLLNPALIAEQREPLKDVALVVVDDTASMRLGERKQQIAAALENIKKQTVNFTDLELITLNITGHERSDLFHAISQKLTEIPAHRLAGVVILSDGQIHDVPDNFKLAAPLHALITGYHNEIDRRLAITAAPAYGIVGQNVSLTLQMTDDPAAQGTTAPIVMQQEGGESHQFKVKIGEPVTINVPITHGGANLFAFTTPTLPDELTPINNSVAVSINGIRDHLRVLLVSGTPHTSTRVWRNLLKSDPAVELVHFTILRIPEKFYPTPQEEMALIPFPTQELFETKLHSFDLIIFDRFQRTSMLPRAYLTNIADYVHDGGALLFAPDTSATAADNDADLGALTELLPAKSINHLLTQAFVPSLTQSGERHPVSSFLHPAADQTSSFGSWQRQIATGAIHDDAMILLNGAQQQPLLLLSHAGKGRVAQFTSDQFWLWARHYENGGPHSELLRRLAHWLMQEPELAESTLTAKAEPSDSGWQITITEHQLDDAVPQVTLTAPDGTSQTVSLSPSTATGIFTATIAVADAGLYHLSKDELHSLVIAGGAETPEFSAMIATEKVIAPPVAATHGGTLWLSDIDNNPALHRTAIGPEQSGWHWLGLQRNGEYRVTGSRHYPLWPAWLCLGLILAITLFGWHREGEGKAN